MAEKTIFRKRFIPLETIALKDDCILFESDTRMVTRWKSLKPRKDIGGGISAYFMDKGIKVSKIFAPDGHFVHWYCDMIRTVSSGDTITFIDLLIDVVIDPEGRIHILDAAEAADALEGGLITADISVMHCARWTCFSPILTRGAFAIIRNGSQGLRNMRIIKSGWIN